MSARDESAGSPSEVSPSPVAELRNPLRVVGIGASAGGLEALRSVVRNLLPGLGACYAVAQHLSPSHRSMLVDLLGREAKLPVYEIADGLVPKVASVRVSVSGPRLVWGVAYL